MASGLFTVSLNIMSLVVSTCLFCQDTQLFSMNAEKKFTFKDIDMEGMETLESIAVAKQFNRWMYDTVSPRMKGLILEIGSGIGNISQFFLEDQRSIVLSDIRDNYCDYLRDKFSESPSLKGVAKIDLTHPEFETEYKQYLGSFDTVFALNVVEHIEDHQQAITNSYKLLNTGGRLVILVPAYPALYNTFDTTLEHYRRYTKTDLKRLFDSNGFEIGESYHFNAAGMPGWFLFGSVLRRKIIANQQMKWFDKMVPLFKFADRCLMRQIGLSVVVEGVKK